MQPESKRVSLGDSYWFVNIRINRTMDLATAGDTARFKAGNYFKNDDDAKKAVQLLDRQLKRICEGQSGPEYKASSLTCYQLGPDAHEDNSGKPQNTYEVHDGRGTITVRADSWSVSVDGLKFLRNGQCTAWFSSWRWWRQVEREQSDGTS